MKLLGLFKGFFFSMQVLLFLILCLQPLNSCVPYKIATQDLPPLSKEKPSEQDLVVIEQARAHYLYSLVPRHYSQLYFFDLPRVLTWSFFGNDDDGIFGEEPTSDVQGPISLSRFCYFFLRNPCHNLCFYVLGTAYMPNSELTIFSFNHKRSKFLQYVNKGSTDFAGPNTSFFLGLHGWKPFMSLRFDYGRRLELYFGWRSRGNFGLKFLPFRAIDPEKIHDQAKRFRPPMQPKPA